MVVDMISYVIAPCAAVLDALKIIDKNTKGFVFVITDNGRLVGTLTDGDIRRAFILGKKPDTCVEDVCTRKFKFLTVDNTLSEAVELFKNKAIKFIPILNSEGSLVNFITKPQLHALLLQDIQADLLYDFQSLDEGIVDHEIYQRPWGFYKTTVMNDYFRSKVIHVKPEAQLSLQSHKHREEHWIVAHGTGKVQIGESVIDIKCGSELFIPKGCKHRLINTNSTENLIVTEVQIGDYFGEDDIVRYEDIYGRI